MIDPGVLGTDVTVAAADLQSFRHFYGKKAEGCTSSRNHLYRLLGCNVNNSKLYERCGTTDDAQVEQEGMTIGRIYHLGIMLHLFMVLSNAITVCHTICGVIVFCHWQSYIPLGRSPDMWLDLGGSVLAMG